MVRRERPARGLCDFARLARYLFESPGRGAGWCLASGNRLLARCSEFEPNRAFKRSALSSQTALPPTVVAKGALGADKRRGFVRNFLLLFIEYSQTQGAERVRSRCRAASESPPDLQICRLAAAGRRQPLKAVSRRAAANAKLEALAQAGGCQAGRALGCGGPGKASVLRRPGPYGFVGQRPACRLKSAQTSKSAHCRDGGRGRQSGRRRQGDAYGPPGRRGSATQHLICLTWQGRPTELTTYEAAG